MEGPQRCSHELTYGGMRHDMWVRCSGDPLRIQNAYIGSPFSIAVARLAYSGSPLSIAVDRLAYSGSPLSIAVARLACSGSPLPFLADPFQRQSALSFQRQSAIDA